MQFYVVRHGIAVQAADHDGPDETRPLTPEGFRRVVEVARGLAALGAKPRVLLTSPLLRAVQTAEALSSVLQTVRIEKTAILTPDADPELALAEVRRKPDREIMFVGHLPHLDLLIAAALGVSDPVTRLKKCGAACLELDAAGGRLVWLVEPKLLRQR